jgi:hypothetical protein
VAAVVAHFLTPGEITADPEGQEAELEVEIMADQEAQEAQERLDKAIRAAQVQL